MVSSARSRPVSSTAAAVNECLCTSTPITIIQIASYRWGRPASGQASLEAAAKLLSGHARRSREGGGDTTLASRHQPTVRNGVSRRRPESPALAGRHPSAENDSEFRNVPRRIGWLGLAAPGRPGRRAGANRSSRWRGSKAVTAHDLAKPFDVRRAVAAEHVGDISEVARAHQTRADDRKEAGVNV